MRYLCDHCNETFDFEGSGRARCPKCMRVHDIRPYQEPLAVKTGAKSPFVWLLPSVFLVLAIGGGAFWWWQRAPASRTSESAPLSPFDRTALDGQLNRLGIKVGELSELLRPDDKVGRFAREATAGKSNASQQASALVDAVRQKASRRAFVRWPLRDARPTDPMLPGRVLEAIQKEGAENRLYPLEIVTFSVAALRSVGVPAMVAEAYTFSGDRAPPDPSGRIGYFVLAVPGQKDAAYQLFDPYGGRALPLQSKDVQVLTDLQAIGAALSLRALSSTARQEEAQKAIADSDAALQLSARSPTVRSARGAILLASGGVEQGYEQMQAAAQIRPDGPRRHNLAIVLLVKGEVEAAQREVTSALSEYRDYTEAHATLAGLYIARSEFELARAELEEATRLEPSLPTLQAIWAQYYASQGKFPEAVAQAERAVKSRPDDPQSHLLLAQLFYQATRYDDMRREARAALALVPLSQKEEVRRGIKRLLGPTALEEPSQPPAESAGSIGAIPAPGSNGLKLELQQPGSDGLRLRGIDSKLRLTQ